MAPQNKLAVLMMWKDEQMIKVITGDPGSGKTALLAEYQQYLRTAGVPDDRIVSINFGTLKLLPNYHILYESIKARLDPNDTTYIPIQELWLEEASSLLALPEYPFSVFRYAALSVSKYGFVTIENNKYGLNPQLSGKTVQAKIYYDHVEFFHDHQPVGTYKRSYGSGEEIYDWTQYVTTLCKKPGAVEHTRFFSQLPALWQTHLKQTSGKERKNALFLLDEMVADGNAGFCDDVLELAHENGRTDADSIRQCYYMIARKEFHPDPLHLGVNTPVLNYNPNLSAYDGLMGGDVNV